MSCPLQVRVTPEEPGCVCTWLRGCASAGRVCVFIRVAVESCVCVPHDNGARARARALSHCHGAHMPRACKGIVMPRVHVLTPFNLF